MIKSPKKKSNPCIDESVYTSIDSERYQGPVLTFPKERLLEILRDSLELPKQDPKTIWIKWYRYPKPSTIPVIFKGVLSFVSGLTSVNKLSHLYFGYLPFGDTTLYAEVWYEE